MVSTRPNGLVMGGHAITILSRGPSKPHSPTHSTVQYIINHSSPSALQPPKYHTCSVKRPT